MDRKDRIEAALAKAQWLAGDRSAEAWLRLCVALREMCGPEAPPPRFDALLRAVDAAATEERT